MDIPPKEDVSLLAITISKLCWCIHTSIELFMFVCTYLSAFRLFEFLQDSGETMDNKLVAKVGMIEAVQEFSRGEFSLSLSLSLSPPPSPSAWLEHSPGSLEAGASECVCSLDGWEHHLSLPHHDGRDDAGETSADAIWIQRRWEGGRREKESE